MMDESFELIEFNNLKIEFDSIDDKSLLDISIFIYDNLKSADSPDDKQNNLKEKKSTKPSNLAELIILIKERVTIDYKKNIVSKETGKWDFTYFLTINSDNDQTLTLYNNIQPYKREFGNLVYPLLSIRKNKESYFYWNHK